MYTSWGAPGPEREMRGSQEGTEWTPSPHTVEPCIGISMHHVERCAWETLSWMDSLESLWPDKMGCDPSREGQRTYHLCNCAYHWILSHRTPVVLTRNTEENTGAWQSILEAGGFRRGEKNGSNERLRRCARLCTCVFLCVSGREPRPPLLLWTPCKC